MNERAWEFLALDLMAPDFALVDETTGISTQGQAHEVAVADSSLDCYYRGVEFDFRIASRTESGNVKRRVEWPSCACITGTTLVS